MTRQQRIERVYACAPAIVFDNTSKFVIISDCHRGTDDGADDFAKNQNAYHVALTHYYKNGFSYIELGDGDELWKNNDFNCIISTYGHVFKLLSKFYKENRLYMIYGNHDIAKRKKRWVQKNLYSYYSCRLESDVPLFPRIKAHEGLILRHRHDGWEMLLLHGHQADFFNDDLWPLSKFLVRRLWRPLELVGVKDPTSSAKNHKKKRAIEDHLTEWAKKEKKILIAGHTHRSMFPMPGEPAYFNDGCCVYPRHIMALEIERGMITLVKWGVQTCGDNILCIRRNVVAGPQHIEDYYKACSDTGAA